VGAPPRRPLRPEGRDHVRGAPARRAAGAPDPRGGRADRHARAHAPAERQLVRAHLPAARRGGPVCPRRPAGRPRVRLRDPGADPRREGRVVVELGRPHRSVRGRASLVAAPPQHRAQPRAGAARVRPGARELGRAGR
jgi:hypothetical protein